MKCFELILGKESKGLIFTEELEILCSLYAVDMDKDAFDNFISRSSEPDYYRTILLTELKNLIDTTKFENGDEINTLAWMYGYSDDAVESLQEKIEKFNNDECKELLKVLNGSKLFFKHFLIADPSREYKRYRRLHEGYKQAYEDLVKISERAMDTIMLEKALLMKNGIDYWTNEEEQSKEYAEKLKDELKKYNCN